MSKGVWEGTAWRLRRAVFFTMERKRRKHHGGKIAELVNEARSPDA